MNSSWPRYPMKEVAPLVRRPVKVDPAEAYREIGIRSFGRGVFHKPLITGLEIGSKRVFSIQPGDLLFNIVFAWEGAVAVAGEQERGTIGSHRFLTCVPDSARADPRYLAWWFSRDEGRDQLLHASPGGAGRNRTLGIDKLAAIDVRLPPVAEQRRVVGRLDELSVKVAEAGRLRDEAAAQAEALIVSTHLALSESKPKPMDSYIRLDEDEVRIVPGTSYPQVGIRGFGAGLFAKPPVLGGTTTYRTFNRLYPGALVMSQVKGWEGAVAVVPDELAGSYASPEYRTFRCREDRCLPEYLGMIVPTEFFWGQLKNATRGVGARRERTRPEQFLGLELRMPTIANQQHALKAFRLVREVQRLQTHTNPELEALMPAMLEQAFNGHF